MRNLLQKKISFWMFLMVIIILIGGFVGWIVFFNKKIYNYNLSLPQNNGTVFNLQYGSQSIFANPDYFQKAVDNLINQKATFLLMDLSSMKLEAYIGGRLVKTVPILAKGKEGSWWETPAGIYKIESKERKHYSSFAGVYFDWAMAFQGNFFIHGWPYYPNGTKVSSAYSGGCVRLAESDAKDIYEITSIGEPVLVFETNFKEDNFEYQQKIPGLTTTNYLATDIKNNFVFFEKSPKENLSAPSASKLLSSLVTLDYINLEKTLTIRQSNLISRENSHLKVGQKVSLYDLLHLFLLESSPDAAEILINQVGKERFIELMNEKARAIGMENSNFEDALREGEGNASNAEDLFLLSKYVYNNRSFIYKLTSQKIDYSSYRQPIFSDLENLNKIDVPEFFGGVWGKSQAGKESMISVFEVNKDGNKRPISIIVLNSEDAKKDTEIIFNYIKNIFF